MGRLVLIILVLFSATAIYSEASATGHRQAPTAVAAPITDQLQAARSLRETDSQYALAVSLTD